MSASSRTVYSTSGTFTSAGGSTQQPQQSQQQQQQHQYRQQSQQQPRQQSQQQPREQQYTQYNQRTGQSPQQERPGPYKFGDVVFVLRRLEGTLQPIYHHAGIVTEVVGGQITQILHFDPLFDRNGHGELPAFDVVKQSIVGIHALPEFLDGQQLRTVFPPEDVHIEEHGPSDDTEIALVRSRIDVIKTEIKHRKTRLYQLHAYNCQHFAMELRTGTAHSADAVSVFESLRVGLDAGVQAWNDNKGGSDVVSSLAGGLAFLMDGGAAAALSYFDQLQNRKTEAANRKR